MKKNFTLLLLAIFTTLSINSYSQCTSANSTYTDLNGAGGAPCTDALGACALTDPAWASIGVYSSEAYLLDNVQSGFDYVFDMCNGTGAGAWIPAITIVSPSGTIDAFDLGTTGTFTDNCSLSWTASESGTYTIYIHETGAVCTGGMQSDNGVPTVACGTTAASCTPPVACNSGVLTTTGSPFSVCPEDSFTVATDGTEATNNDYAIFFSPQASGAGGLGGAFSLTNVTFPYTSDNDLSGVLSSNSYPVMTGEWAMYTIARDDTNGICAISTDSIIVDFLSAGDAGCAPAIVCNAGIVNTTGSPFTICPVDSFTLATDGTEATTNDFAILFSPLASGSGGTGSAITLYGVTFPYTADNDLNGVLSFNSLPVLSGEWAMYTVARDDTGGVCAISVDSIIVNFLDSADALCNVVVGQPGDCEDIIFSEIIEGSSSNKCIELYNPTNVAIDLAAGNYAINRYNNGGTSASATPLTGIVPAQGTFVICNSSVAANFAALADVVGGTMNQATYYNGDDVLELTKNNDSIVLDVFGTIGFDPGSGWNDGGCATNNKTLVRNIDILVGDIISSDTFLLSEWTCYPMNDDSHLGWHLSDCVPPVCNPFTITNAIVEDTCGNNTGEIDLTVSGGFGINTYSWSDTTSNEDISSASSGSYTVLITDEAACDTTLTFTIPSLGVDVTLATSTTDVVNCTVADGTATVTISTSNGSPFTYLWDDAATQTTDIATALSANTYNVTVTDGWGCSASASATVANASGFTVDVNSITDVTCNGLTTGSISVTTTGGTPTFSYSWTDASSAVVGTMESLTGVGAGTYTLEATDNANCNASLASAVTITEPDALSVIFDSSNDVSCANGTDGAINVIVSGGTSPYSYAWTDGAGVIGTTEDISGLSAGSYSIGVIDDNTCPPASLTNLVITEPTAIVITIDTETNPSCAGASDGSINVTVEGGTPNYTFVWSNSETTEDISGLSAGSYTLTVTDEASCEETSVTVELVEPSALSATATSTDETAASSDGTATVTVSGGTPNYTYLWSPSAQTTATATGLDDGNYSCEITDANGCSIETEPVVVLAFVSSINNINLSNFSIYPNPTNGLFTVQFETNKSLDFDISILNTIGKKVFTDSYSKVNGKFNKQFNLNIANGIYFLEINTKEGKSVRKITINK